MVFRRRFHYVRRAQYNSLGVVTGGAHGHTCHQLAFPVVHVSSPHHRCMDPPANGEDNRRFVGVLICLEPVPWLDRCHVDPGHGQRTRLQPGAVGRVEAGEVFAVVRTGRPDERPANRVFLFARSGL